MEQRMSLVTLGVADLRRARRFYENGLGWKPGFASDEVVFYETGGPIIALWNRRDLAADAQIEDDEWNAPRSEKPQMAAEGRRTAKAICSSAAFCGHLRFLSP
jgi:catechol 2,3-dioxygenase-like lactoylglutathione lyase family enzyme